MTRLLVFDLFKTGQVCIHVPIQRCPRPAVFVWEVKVATSMYMVPLRIGMLVNILRRETMARI